MADYCVWGKKGTGKSKFAVYVIRQALGMGRRIACNFPVDIGKLLPEYHRITYTQLPARPRREHLDALGHGNPGSFDEERNGVLVLDELAIWLNARTFQDERRSELIDFLVHARKKGWDCYFLCQNPVQIDRQVRESLLEYSVQMRALDKVRLPFVGYLLSMFGMRGTFPKGMHSAVVKLGFEEQAPLCDRIVFKGNELHDAYDTRHVFVDDPEAVPFTGLGPRYFVPLPVRSLSFFSRIRGFLASAGRPSPAKPARKPHSRLVDLLLTLPPDLRWVETCRLVRLGVL